MHILLTNDNGFAAPGLWEMAQALRIFGKVTVLVPEQDWASEGCYEEAHAMRIRLATLPDNSTMIVGCGNPSDCVSYGLMGFLSQDVDLVVSGVNAMPTSQHHLMALPYRVTQQLSSPARTAVLSGRNPPA